MLKAQKPQFNSLHNVLLCNQIQMNLSLQRHQIPDAISRSIILSLFINLPTVDKFSVKLHSIRATKPRKYLHRQDLHLFHTRTQETQLSLRNCTTLHILHTITTSCIHCLNTPCIKHSLCFLFAYMTSYQWSVEFRRQASCSAHRQPSGRRHQKRRRVYELAEYMTTNDTCNNFITNKTAKIITNNTL